MHAKHTFYKGRTSLRVYFLYILLFIMMMILQRRFTIFLLITSVVGVLAYYNHSARIPFDLSPVLVVSLIISRQYTLMHSIAFIILSGIIPMILAGGSFDHTTLFYVFIRFLVNSINVFLRPFPVIPSLIAMSVLDHLLGTIGSISLFGAVIPKEVLNLFIQILMDVFYIFSLSSFLIFLL